MTARLMRRLLLAAAAAVVLLVVLLAAAAYWLFARDGFRQALEAQATAWLGQPVRIGAARAQFLPRPAIQLTGIDVGQPVGLHLADGEVAADLAALLRGRIENAEVLVAGSQVDMPLPFGLPDRPAGPEPAVGVPVRIVSISTIRLEGVRLRSRGRVLEVSADSALEGSRLSLRRVTVRSESTTLEAEGIISLSPRVDAQVAVRANHLNLDELLALAQAFGPAGAAGDADGGPGARMVATIAADRADAAGVEATDLAAELTLDSGNLALRDLRMGMFGGRYDGALTARLGPDVSATLESRVADLDVAQLAAFGNARDTVTGTLSGSGTFSGSGTTMAELLAGARGSGRATIVNGTIRQLHLVRTVVLFFGRPAPDAAEGTDRFDRLDVAFSLADRLLRAERFTLQSPDADVAGAGTLHLESKALAGRADLLLSEALSAQAGTDLYRYTREGTRVVLPAAIGGSLGAPRLTIDAAAALRRGLRNEIERRFDGWLERLRR